MDSLLVILKIILVLLMDIVVLKHVTHMFQQNRYDYKRFYQWIMRNFLYQVETKLFYLVFPVTLLIFFVLSISLSEISFVIISLLVSIFLFENENKKKYIKPLVYTARVKRILSILVFMNIILIYFFVEVVGLKYQLFIIPISLVINWLFVYISDFILIPVEKLIQKYYLNDAKKKLDSFEGLVKIGITGSFGKTSSKNIVQSIISEKFRSLMTPASFNTPMGVTRTIREYLKPTHQVFVCEMGADHVGDIKELSEFVRPKYGVVTSIGPQHLATFGSLENIINEKMKLVELLPDDGVGIINYDNEYIENYVIKNNCKIVTYGIDNPNADYRAVNIKYSVKGSKFKVVFEGKGHLFETKLLGKHNISNILAGIALSRCLNIEWKDIVKAVKQIDYIEHRLEVKTINGYKFIDNAFNSNPVGANMSLEVMKMMPNKRFIITPGMIDLGEIQDKVNYEFGFNMKGCIDVAILVGDKQVASIKKGLEESGFDKDNIYICKTVREAFSLVYSLANINDTILLENDLPDAFSN